MEKEALLAGPPTHAVRWIMHEASFTRLLALLAVGLGLRSVLLAHPLAGRAVSIAVSLTLVGLVLRSTRSRVLITLAVLLAVTHEVTGIVRGLDLPALRLAGMASTCAFLALASGLIVATIWREQDVTTDTILGGVSVYLMVGFAWGVVYSIVELLAPGSFVLNTAAGGDLELAHRLIYYSYVTLTTLGYGDIVPTTSIASGLAAMEAVTGQLFVAILIARVVGLYVAERSDA